LAVGSVGGRFQVQGFETSSCGIEYAHVVAVVDALKGKRVRPVGTKRIDVHD